MDRPATITLHVPHALRGSCDGASELAIEATSVRFALEALETLHPKLYRSVCDETGAVRRHIGVFVNNSHINDRNGLDTPLSPGDAVYVMPAVSGG